MFVYPDYETEYLTELIISSVKSEPAPIPKKKLNNEKLFALAKKQQIYNMILMKLEEVGILTEQELSEWKNYYFSEMTKIITINLEREKICGELENKQIKYMYLKGLDIREYYPKSIMRQMSDNDILYDADKRSLLMKIMKSNGYYLGAADGYADDFHKKPYCTFEFHRTLFSDQDEFCPEFDPWKNAKKCDDSFRYEMSREDNYIYTVSHLYKHYYCQKGCGIRFFCDLYLLLKNDVELDKEYIDKVLDDFGIKKFNELVLKLIDTLFENGTPDDEQQDLIDIIFESSIYGKGSDKVKKSLEECNGSTLKYFIKRIFPPKKVMAGNYKSLENHIYLLPFYYVYRLIEKLYHNKDGLKMELKLFKKYKK